MSVGVECECGRGSTPRGYSGPNRVDSDPRGEEVAFWIDGEEIRPRSTCECGETYELRIRKVN